MKGEEDKLFDDFLRKSLGNYQVKPSPAIWKGLLQKVPARRIGRIPFSGGNSGLIGLISGGIIITSVALYNNNSNKHHKSNATDTAGTLSAQTVYQKPANAIDTSTFIFNNKISQPIETNSPNSNDITGNADEKIKYNEANPGKPQQEMNAPVTTAFLSEKVHKTASKTLVPATVEEVNTRQQSSTIKDTRNTAQVDNKATLAMNSEKAGALAELNVISIKRSYYYDLAGKLIQTPSIQADPLRQNPKAMKISKWQGDYAGRNAELSVGIYYQPEWLNNPSNSQFGATRQNAGLLLGWKKRPFIVETGLGFMQEKAVQNYDLFYHRLLGTYNDLQYVTFDTTGGIIIPHYYYVTDSVFDKDQNLQKSSNMATYTYLQVPLTLGLEKTYGRSSFFVKTGPVLSLLIDKSEDKLIIDADKHIIVIAGDHPDRLKTSWQWYFGLGYTYAFTDRLSFFVEPSLRGYLKTPYEKKRSQNENPVFMGVRTGISLQFKNPVIK